MRKARRALWTLLAVLTLRSLPAAAQALPWIDLSGDWRIQRGDDPRFADPGFDDAAWNTVSLPGPLPIARGDFFWLRRTVDLPSGLDQTKLALTLGKLTENYELFINGRRIWSSGFTRAETQLARPRTFDLPPAEGRKLSIGVRGWSHGFYGSTAWQRQPDQGPYLLTALANAPRIEERAFIEHLRMQRTLDLVAGVLLFTLAVILLLMFSSDRARLELLWLGLCCGALGWMRLVIVLSISVDSTPWADVFISSALPAILFLEFLMADLDYRRRWIRVLGWSTLLWGIILQGQIAWRQSAAGHLATDLLSAGVLAASIARRQARSPERLLVTAAALIILLSDLRTNVLPNLAPETFNPLPTMQLRIGPYVINSYPILLALFTFLMVTVLIRRLLLDREHKQRLASEFEAARAVQGMFLSLPAAPGASCTVDAIYEPAQEVGGDFYQVLDRTDGSRLVLVGDVSGKGLKAAMLVSFAVGALQRESSSSPAVILDAMNEALAGHTGGGFITCCCVRVEPDGTVTVANAGHLAPYLNGRELEMEGGLPLGVIKGAAWPSTSAVLATGEQMTLVSDGVVEAQNAQGELFGFDRARDISLGAARDIAAAARAWGQNDDITVVTVRRTA